MNVHTVWSSRTLARTDEERVAFPERQFIKKPFPNTSGVWVMFNKGDLYSPDSWSTPTRCYRTMVRWLPRPYVALRWGRFGFYLGWKIWGCDTEKQLVQIGINAKEVYPGSMAMQGFTWRASRNVG